MNRSISRFAAVFFLCLLGFSVFAVVVDLQNHLRLLEESIAAASTWLARLTGSPAQIVDGNYISVQGMSLNINHECTGIFVFFVLISFIVAYPARWGMRLAGIAVGIVALTLVNILRIATLVRLVEYYPSMFVYFHEYVWQGIFLMMVTLYSITWVEWARR